MVARRFSKQYDGKEKILFKKLKYFNVLDTKKLKYFNSLNV